MKISEDIPISRGTHTFIKTAEGIVSSDNSILIKWSRGGPQGYREYNLLSGKVDTLFIAYRSLRARNEGEKFWLISWHISQTSVANRNKARPVPFVFPSVEVERLTVQAIADFLWTTDDTNVAGNFQVERVTLAGGTAKRLGWGSYGLH